MSGQKDMQVARKGRLAGMVIAGAAVLWIAARGLEAQGVLPTRFAILAELFVLAAFFWALVLTYQIWRARQTEKG